MALGIPGADLDTVTREARSNRGRRFRLQAILTLQVVRSHGTRKQRRETDELAQQLAEDDDALLAAAARWARSAAAAALE